MFTAFTAVILAALVQSAAINGQRDKYEACLTKAFDGAKAQNMPAEALDTHLRQACTSIEESFEGALIAFDLKNKVPRNQAAADAQLQVNDLVDNLVERYRALAARQ